MNITAATLIKVAHAPGLCTLEEIDAAVAFLTEYKAYRDMYKAAYHHDPVGLTLESKLDDLDYYKDRA